MTMIAYDYCPSIIMQSYLDFSHCRYFDYNQYQDYMTMNMTIGNYMAINYNYTINNHVEYI